MVFNSYNFLFLFLPACLICIRLAQDRIQYNALKWVIILFSIIFYSFWRFEYVLLLILSISTNYFIGYQIVRSRQKNMYIIIGVFINIFIIVYYKYTNFFVSQVSYCFGNDYTFKNIILPLGISFFTFQQIAFLVDLYKGKTSQTEFRDYLLFVSFFPQLIAGPICRHKYLIEQLKTIFVNYRNVYNGIFIFVIGLSKKVLIADNISGFVDSYFSSTQGIDFFSAWAAGLFFTFQIYFDFSGYSDMAIGLGRMFGIKLPENFLSPFKSLSIIEFWRRWHVTLSTFLRDYLYIPFGGNSRGIMFQSRNLLATMFLGGLWHGASWTFIIWGLIHGGLLIINHFYSFFINKNRYINIKSRFFGKFFCWFVTFLCVVFAFVIFRADNIKTAIEIWSGMLGLNGIMIPVPYFLIEKMSVLLFFGISLAGESLPFYGQYAIIILLCFAIFLPDRQKLFEKYRKRNITIVLISFLFSICLASLNRETPFIYFDF